LVLNPSFARGWSISGLLKLWAGQPDIAIEHADAALRLSPRARVGATLVTIGRAHFLSRRFDEAMQKLLLSIQDDSSNPQPYRWLAACYAQMGRLDDARETVERLCRDAGRQLLAERRAPRAVSVGPAPGGDMSQTRRLAAILAADVAGYSRLIGVDEEGTLNRLRAIRATVIDPSIARYRGRIVKTTGDGLLVEFASVVDALRCAAEWQAGMAAHGPLLPPEQRIEFRIGINVGDIVVEDGDIFGDGVNVAARLEGLAEPGGICVVGPCSGGRFRAARPHLRRYGRAEPQEHCPPGAGLPGSARYHGEHT
jgi:class 3 adenylate cyclase